VCMCVCALVCVIGSSCARPEQIKYIKTKQKQKNNACTKIPLRSIQMRTKWYVAVCCSVLQCVAVCCSVLECVAVCYSVL